MNILFTTPTYYPHKGGAESCIEDLATAYVKRGHQVTVVTSRSPDSLPKHEIREGVSIVRIKPLQPISNLKQALSNFFRGIVALTQLLIFIRRQRVNIVCIGLVGADSLLVLVLSYVLRFRLIVYIHGGELRCYIKISPLVRWSLKRCLRKAFAIIAVSEELKQETISFVPAVADKIVVLPNAVDIRRVQQAKPYAHPRKYLLYAGRLDPVKGIETLIAAFRQVSKQLPDLDLLIVGTGVLENSLLLKTTEHGLDGRIFFLGDRERPTVFSLLKSCEFLVLPSFSEGCPLAVLEGLAAGKITIGSRAKGISTVIQHEKTGVLFKMGDAEELSKLILQYYTDPETRSQLEINIKNNGLDAYDITTLCEKHLQVYTGFREKLKICLISEFYYQDQSCAGLSSYYFNLAKSLLDLGHELFLITSDTNDSSNSDLRTIALKQPFLTRAHANTLIAGLQRVTGRLWFAFKAHLKVRELDKTTHFDVIDAPELMAPALFVGLTKRKKLVTRVHTPTYIVDHYNQRYRYSLIGKLLSLPERVQTRMSRGVSVASKCLASTVAKDWGIQQDQIQIIPNPVQIDWVKSLASQHRREIAGDYLLYFGRLEKRKGVHIISQALPQVLSRQPELRMVFIGPDCGLKDQILHDNESYAERILFFERFEKARLFSAIKHARLILLPSLFENLSNAGLEAMSLGKAVIGTYGTSFEEIIVDNVNGFLVPAGDPDALSAKIVYCTEGIDLNQVGINAFESIQPFDSQTTTQLMVDFYRQTMSGP